MEQRLRAEALKGLEICPHQSQYDTIFRAKNALPDAVTALLQP